jgi:hypothetical protein
LNLPVASGLTEGRTDGESVDLPHVEAAQEEAARTLADLACQRIRGLLFHQMAVEVRDLDGPVLKPTSLGDHSPSIEGRPRKFR